MELYRHFTGTTYTSGVQQLAEKKSAYWIIDAISSHVVANSEFKKRCSTDPMFEDMQIWILKKKQDGAKLIAVADTVPEELNAPTCEQEIPFTDFEFGEDISRNSFVGDVVSDISFSDTHLTINGNDIKLFHGSFSNEVTAVNDASFNRLRVIVKNDGSE